MPDATPDRAAYVIEQAMQDWHAYGSRRARVSSLAEFIAARLHAEGLLRG